MKKRFQCEKCGRRDPGKCKDPSCPVKARMHTKKKVNLEAKEEYFGKSPNVFVGRHGYPDVNVGVLNTEEYRDQDEPQEWVEKDYDISRILGLRTELVNARFKTSVKSFKNRLSEVSKEVSQAEKPVDVEVGLDKKPSFQNLTFQQKAKPHGPSVDLEKARVTENPKVPKEVDSAVEDTDFKADKAVKRLYDHGHNHHYLTKLFSMGNLGVQKNRKLVPTRWSITAVDDSVGKQMIKEIKDYETIGHHRAYFGSHLGNYYFVLLFPEPWSYELIETALPEEREEGMTSKSEGVWQDHENYHGRKEYASETAGGYYAARTAVVEELKRIKKQASVLVLRLISKDYYAPLGVWVCREAARNSTENKPVEFANKQLMMKYVKLKTKKTLNHDVESIVRKSVLLDRIENQKKISQF